MRGDLILRHYQPGDEHAILALHNQEFAGHAARDLATWRWRFQEHPLGTTQAVAAFEPGGRCVGVYAGYPLRARLFGEACLSGVHVDVCLDRRFRDGIGGTRLLVSLMRAFHQEHVGGEARFVFGYPEPQLQRVGLRFVRFHVLRDVCFLVREAEAPIAAPAHLRATVCAELPSEVDALWQSLSSQIPTGVVRDHAYLDWRYRRHPEVRHVFVVARDEQGRLRGLCVAREGGWDPRLASLMDWLVPEDDLDTEAALLDTLCRWARERGRTWVAGWFAGAPELSQGLQRRHGFVAQWTPYQECFRSTDPRATRRELSRNLFQTMGDIDFF